VRHPAARAISRQTFGLLRKIEELDAVVRSDRSSARWLIEAHPEVCFARMRRDAAPRGAELCGKKTPDGRRQRMALVEREFPDVKSVLASVRWVRASVTPSGWRRREVGIDDMLDAYATLWTALRWRRGIAEVLGDECDARGIPMRIVV
jgi:predicted RNase H-like nuclease